MNAVGGLFRTCPTTGLQVHKDADALIRANAVAATVALLIGGIAAILVLLTRWQVVHLLPGKTTTRPNLIRGKSRHLHRNHVVDICNRSHVSGATRAIKMVEDGGSLLAGSMANPFNDTMGQVDGSTLRLLILDACAVVLRTKSIKPIIS